MPLMMNGQTYYRTIEVCQIAGISRNTLFRWLKKGVLSEPDHKDRRGWRLFTKDEVSRVKMEVNRINKANRD